MVSFLRPPRLGPHPTNIIDRSQSISFEFDGKLVSAHPGDTVASALYAAGVRIFSRSFKYHRSRGLLCVSGNCPNCLMTIDGIPNVRTCTEIVRDGMSVRHQNAWPSLEHDAFSVLDRFDRLMPVGFYYKAFYRPKMFWSLVSPIIRRVAGLGTVDMEAIPDLRYDHESRHAEVVVVGGGPAGISASLAASGAGAQTILVDDQPSLGGHLRFDTQIHRDLPDTGGSYGYELASQLAESVTRENRLELMAPATVFGLYEDNMLAVLSGSQMTKIRARQVVIATGTYEIPLIFDRNDLPGVMLSTGVQRLLHLYGIRPGNAALVATSNDEGYQTALDLLRAGVRVVAVADLRPNFPMSLDAAVELQSQGVLVLTSHFPIRAEGTKRVVGVTVTRLIDGIPSTQEKEFDCDLIVMSGGFNPASSLLAQAGGTFTHDLELGETVPDNLPNGVLMAGEVSGIHDLSTSIRLGRLAGLEAAMNVSTGQNQINQQVDEVRHDFSVSESHYRSGVDIGSHPSGTTGAKQFVCFCEDVTSKDVKYAIDEGFDDIQTLKRYSTVTMGPCQGKMCLKSFLRIAAHHSGQELDALGSTTARPPVGPVPLAALAGQSHIPLKRSPIDRKHREMGAQMIDVGPWMRAHNYGSPHDECMAVRNRVGIIDVSTLGKLDVRGRDAPGLLDRLYTHHFSNLGIGKVRYGVLCAEDGAILDDGTVTRIADDHYFVTTSTANIDVIEQWFKWWIAGTDICAHVTNVTSGYASINVAGPNARKTLAKLTDVDLSTKAFGYMRSAQGLVAGVPCIFLRIGFVGETGWELHFPAQYGEYMWDALLNAGSEFGIAPFGMEAQRILRLEKGHIIPGQDTDALTTPFNVDMDWVVRLDKEDFIGRAGLVASKDRGPKDKLVGFVMRDKKVPEDGSAVVIGSLPVGRVTSSRLSPTLGRGFGLAFVSADLAVDGGEIFIRIGTQNYPADVRLKPVYDPEGRRLRE